MRCKKKSGDVSAFGIHPVPRRDLAGSVVFRAEANKVLKSSVTSSHKADYSEPCVLASYIEPMLAQFPILNEKWALVTKHQRIHYKTQR